MEWNTQKKIWQHSTADHLFEQWELFSETWPTSGMTRNGQVFELPMQERHTSDSESSSSPIPLFGTLTTEPTVRSDAFRGKGTNVAEFVKDLLHTPDATPDAGNTRIQNRTGPQGLGKQAKSLAPNLLPTTRANEPGSTSPGYGDSLNDIANRVVNGHARKDLLPTPAVSDNRGAARSEVEAGDPKHRLKVAVELLPTTRSSMANGASQKELEAGNPKFRIETVTNWGKFEPAIKRWEQVIERKAPAPTKPDGKDGNHRLSSKFTEWMMGLPEGWITDVGLTRNEELKACGNGVVPQQAELALRILLQDIPFASTGGGK